MAFGFWDPLRDFNRLAREMDTAFSAPGVSGFGSTPFDVLDRQMLTEGEQPLAGERGKRARRAGYPVDTLLTPEAQRDVMWTPRMDIREQGEDLVIHMELPGLTKEEIKVEFNNGVLSVSGERKMPDVKENETLYRRERLWGKFLRTIRLPEGVKDDQIIANFDNGILEIRMPHGQERKPERKAINIQ